MMKIFKLLLLLLILSACTVAEEPLPPFPNDIALSDDGHTIAILGDIDKYGFISLTELLKTDTDLLPFTDYFNKTSLSERIFSTPSRYRNYQQELSSFKIIHYNLKTKEIANFDITRFFEDNPHYNISPPYNANAFIEDSVLYYSPTVHRFRDPRNDSGHSYEYEPITLVINTDSLEATEVIESQSDFINDPFYEQTNFITINTIYFAVQKNTDGISKISLRQEYFPSYNPQLYTIFPGLEYAKDNKNSGDSDLLLYSDIFTTPDTIMSLLNNQQSPVNWEGVVILGKHTKEGKDYPLSSYEDYLLYKRTQEESQ